jgi:hypothetical protein
MLSVSWLKKKLMLSLKCNRSSKLLSMVLKVKSYLKITKQSLLDLVEVNYKYLALEEVESLD